MFKKILIANRGEIGCRIVDTCRRMGVGTVAIYSEADARSRLVRMADEAWCVGPAPSKDSYLRIDRIIEAARTSGAEAVHPGFGFLAENAEFAEACEQAGLVFIGPPASAIRAMGSKSAAKALMDKAGVPLVPGYHGDDQDGEKLAAEADRIGYPVLIKAVSGGGGKGMRVVESADEFAAALASCQREAAASFNDDRVLIEKYITRPRHIEVQIFGDRDGQIIHLNERDCSAQRRHQKVVEEAPAPHMTPARRAEMGRAAVDAGQAVDYVGAGTVEFIVDDRNDFYFMEMNTRLQVEHPVTEMITGIDLVEWQLRIAAGEPLPQAQQDIGIDGHSIEVRVYAEEPANDFLPSIGTLVHFQPPRESRHVRVETGVESGDAVSPHYDPMLAKLIVWDENREQATERMLQALSEFRVLGVGNNIAFLSRLVDHAAFRQGEVDTHLIAREGSALTRPAQQVASPLLAAAALWLVDREGVAGAETPLASPWLIRDAWRANAGHDSRMTFSVGDDEHEVVVHREAGQTRLTIDDETRPAEWRPLDDTRGQLVLGDLTCEAQVLRRGDVIEVYAGGQSLQLTHADPLDHVFEEDAAEGGLTAPMPGSVIELLVEQGSKVSQGDALLVMEAMKMEHTIYAPANGTVDEFLYQPGEQVDEGAELVSFTPEQTQ
ncbi:MAG: 3-methylcrotonyl-CoA carboxylase [Salinisphaeraceae bacterium]|jgi:3-methylcrotonyl-CoA carboxylase alpha subunit|nr:3-methylcrotonyl-CoA carboxylase [Salinisphaeraceae bacterium]